MPIGPIQRGIIAERDLRVIAMAKGGKRPRLIAVTLDLDPALVGQILRRARSAGEEIPLFTGARPRGTAAALADVLLPDVEKVLAQPAAERGVTIAELAGDLLTAIAAAPALIGTLLGDDL